MKLTLVKKQVNQKLVKNKINFENFQVSSSVLYTKKGSKSVSFILNENLILLKIPTNNIRVLQKTQLSKSILKQNQKNELSNKNVNIGTTYFSAYKTQNNVTNFLESENLKNKSISSIKLNKFYLRMPEDTINN